MKQDIEIAQEAELKPIKEVAEEVGLLPEVDMTTGVITMPIGILPSLDGMQVEDYIQVMFSTPLDGLIEAFETFLQIFKGMAIAFEMAIVQRQAHNGGA